MNSGLRASILVVVSSGALAACNFVTPGAEDMDPTARGKADDPTGTIEATEEWKADVSLMDIWASGPNDLYVVGFDGMILHSTGDGVWTPQNSGTSEDLLTIWGSGPNDIYVGGSGLILHSTGNGDWEIQASFADETIAAMWGSGPNDIYAGVGFGDEAQYLFLPSEIASGKHSRMASPIATLRTDSPTARSSPCGAAPRTMCTLERSAS